MKSIESRDVMLYGETNEKDSRGAEFPLAEPSISCQLPEVRLAEKFVPVRTWEVRSLVKRAPG